MTLAAAMDLAARRIDAAFERLHDALFLRMISDGMNAEDCQAVMALQCDQDQRWRDTLLSELRAIFAPGLAGL